MRCPYPRTDLPRALPQFWNVQARVAKASLADFTENTWQVEFTDEGETRVARAEGQWGRQFQGQFPYVVRPVLFQEFRR